MLPLLLALACAPKDAPPATAADRRSEAPAPLAPRPFQVPETHEGKLGNGLGIVVVENHEVPLVYVNLVVEAGSWTDPDDRPGLASVTMDMLNEGAEGMDAAGLSAALRRLGATLGSSAGLDGSSVAVSCLKDRLEPTLDLMAAVVLTPTFAQADWELMRKKRLQDLAAERDDPGQMSWRVTSSVMYGPTYAGRLSSEAGYAAIEPAAMREWYGRHVVPGNATFLVGGDTTLDEILPLLEARFGAWQATAPDRAQLPQAAALPAHDAARIILVDKPAAPQSVIRVSQFVGREADPDQTAFTLANRVVGGQFSARLNMKLREEKGWTYGARSGTWYNHLPGLWSASAAVNGPATVDAVQEMVAQLRGPLAGQPITEAELKAARDGLLGSWPLDFERPGTLLDQTVEMRRYDLPDDWISAFPDRVRAADLAAVQAAWQAHIRPDAFQIVVVGDAASHRAGLEGLGLPVVMVDADGQPVE